MVIIAAFMDSNLEVCDRYIKPLPNQSYLHPPPRSLIEITTRVRDLIISKIILFEHCTQWP